MVKDHARILTLLDLPYTDAASSKDYEYNYDEDDKNSAANSNEDVRNGVQRLGGNIFIWNREGLARRKKGVKFVLFITINHRCRKSFLNWVGGWVGGGRNNMTSINVFLSMQKVLIVSTSN